MKTYRLLLLMIGAFALAARTDAQTLYGSTSGSGGGELYILDSATGTIVQDVGPLNDSGANNYAVTGLAFNPVTGVLYGSTGGNSGTSLLTINPANGSVNVIGSFNAGTATMTDLAFDQAGNLYGISSSGGANLYSINLNTGQATAIGSSGLTFTEGGGLAISDTGLFYSTPVPADYGTFDPTTGAFTLITNPNKPAGGGAYDALAFNGSALYGINILPGSGGGVTHLVTFDPETGTATDIGASVTHLDGLAFQPVPEPGTVTLGLLGAAGLFFARRKR